MIRRILYQNTILFRLFLVYTVWLCICQFFFLVFFFFWILFNAKIGPQLEIFLAVFPLILHLNLRFLSLVGRTLIRFIALSLFSFLLSSLFCFVVMYSKRKKNKNCADLYNFSVCFRTKTMPQIEAPMSQMRLSSYVFFPLYLDIFIDVK